MTTLAVAKWLIELCKEGDFLRAQEELYHTDIVSIDPDTTKTIGADNMHTKEERFLSSLNKIVSIKYSEPLIAGEFFSVILAMEVDIKDVGNRSVEEICVYQVRDGKIIFEQFFR